MKLLTLKALAVGADRCLRSLAVAVAGFGLAACAPKPASSPPTSTPGPTDSKAVASSDVGGADRIVDTATKSRFPEVRLVSGAAYDLQTRALTPVSGSLVRGGTAYLVWAGASRRGPRLIASIHRGGVPSGLRLFDDRGRRVTTFAHLWGVQSSGNIARVRERITERRSREVIMDLSTGKLTRPKPKLPPGQTAAKTMLLGARESQHVWVITKTKSNRVFAGRWSDLGRSSVVVQTEIPFWPRCRDDEEATLSVEGTGLEVGRPQSGCISDGIRPVAPGSPVTDDCRRIDFGDDGNVTCRAIEAPGLSTVLAGGWSVAVDEDGRAVELVGPGGNVQPAPMPHIFGAWSSSEVLFYDGDQFMLWTPQASRPLPEGIVSPLNHPGVAGATIPENTPVMPMSEFRQPTAAWLDVETQTLFRYESELQALARYRAVPRRFYAKRPEGAGVSLHEVDLDARSVREVGRYGDCDPEQLRALEMQQRQLRVTCETSDTLRWTEVVDLEQGWRGRVDGWAEDDQLERDRILVSPREHRIQFTPSLRFYSAGAAPTK